MHGSKYEYAPFGAVYETSSVRHVLVGDDDTQEVVQAQVVLPRCMGIVAILFVSVIQKHAKFSYHLCILTYSSTENYISLILCTCTCRIWSILRVYDPHRRWSRPKLFSLGVRV